ncbi:MAG: DNA repair protein RadC [Treponema sp.]|nr:DNA repair protein RadC [Treponema sp.]
MYDYISSKQNEKPQVREYLAKHGKDHLTDGDLIMLLLGSGTKSQPVQKLAVKVLETIRSCNYDDLLNKLLEIKGLGLSKACTICAALELGKRQNSHTGKKITTPKDVVPLVQYYSFQAQEHFIVITLNGGNEVINLRIAAIGRGNKAIINPRDIFSEALKVHASSIIICHNHPSGNLIPSEADIYLTEKINIASEFIGIKLLDHIIITTTGFFSFKSNHLLTDLDGPQLTKLSAVI